MDFAKLQKRLQDFANVRDWERFHSPKNLSMALSVEVAELVEHFQWLTESQSSSLDGLDLGELANEIADIQIYLVMLADKLGVNIEQAVDNKMASNAIKHPPSST